MQTIAIILEKGGVSKTTLSINLGVAAALKNKVVAIIDLDPQSSSSEWGDLRSAETPAIIATPASRLNNVIDTALEEGFDLLILDTAPRAEATIEPDQPQRYDYQYERNGVSNLFMFFDNLN